MTLDPHPHPAAVDMLSDAIAYVRPHLMRGSTGDRLRDLWCGVVAARELGAADAIESDFLELARNTGLAAELGRNADVDLRHVIRWAMRGMNPFSP